MKLITKITDIIQGKPKLLKTITIGSALTLYHYQTKKSILITTKKL